MSGWIVLGCVLLGLLVLLCIPLCARVRYDPEGVRLALAVGPITLPVYPKGKKSKKKKPQPQGKPASDGPTEQTEKGLLSPGSWTKFRRYLPLICEAAGELRRRITVRTVRLHLVWAGKDPASAAIGYGAIQGVIGWIWALLDSNFRVKDHKFVVDLDYEQSEPQVQLQGEVSLTLGQALAFCVRYSLKFFAIHREKSRKDESMTTGGNLP